MTLEKTALVRFCSEMTWDMGMLAGPWGSKVWAAKRAKEGGAGRVAELAPLGRCDNSVMGMRWGLDGDVGVSPVISRRHMQDNGLEQGSEVTQAWVQIPLCHLLAS